MYTSPNSPYEVADIKPTGEFLNDGVLSHQSKEDIDALLKKVGNIPT